MFVRKCMRVAGVCAMVLAAGACGSKAVVEKDERDIPEEQMQQVDQMQQMLQQSLQAQKENMERLRQLKGGAPQDTAPAEQS